MPTPQVRKTKQKKFSENFVTDFSPTNTKRLITFLVSKCQKYIESWRKKYDFPFYALIFPPTPKNRIFSSFWGEKFELDILNFFFSYFLLAIDKPRSKTYDMTRSDEK
jgi:hypothetical protein